MPGTGEMSLPRVAWEAELARELSGVAHVQENEPRLTEPPHKLLCGRFLQAHRGNAATMSSSAATAGRPESLSSHSESAG